MTPLEDYNMRAREVRLFLRSLQDLEGKYKTPGKGFYAGTYAIAVSRASAFIMIYNCIEHGFRKEIATLRADIKSNCSSLLELKNHWQSEIIRINFLDPLRQGTNFEEHLKRVREFLPGNVDWLDKAEALPFAGNINKERVFKFVKSIEHKVVLPRGAFGGNDLEIIWASRNSLSHGEESFFNVGSNYTTNDIIEIFDRTKVFMRSILIALQLYRTQRRYLR